MRSEAVTQLTVTVKAHIWVEPGLVAVQVTAETPGGKRKPEGGLQDHTDEIIGPV